MTNELKWKNLGPISPTFCDARLQLHWAVQTIAAAGGAHVESRPDDSHRNIEWFRASNVFAGNLSNTTPPFRLALNPGALELRLLNENLSAVDSLPLAGHTLDDAFEWASSAIASFTGSGPVDLPRPEYELPHHPVASGAAFSAPEPELAQLERWYANSDAALRRLQSQTEAASTVRCWPHHFDIALLISIPPGEDGEARSVGVGMTPGDGTYSDPYWYVSPWPYPTASVLPELDGGHWHTEGWTGAVLEANELVSAADQPGLLQAYLDSAITGSRQLLSA